MLERSKQKASDPTEDGDPTYYKKLAAEKTDMKGIIRWASPRSVSDEDFAWPVWVLTINYFPENHNRNTPFWTPQVVIFDEDAGFKTVINNVIPSIIVIYRTCQVFLPSLNLGGREMDLIHHTKEVYEDFFKALIRMGFWTLKQKSSSILPLSWLCTVNH